MFPKYWQGLPWSHLHAHLFTRLTWSKHIEILGQVSSWKTLDPFLIKRTPLTFEHQFCFKDNFFCFPPRKLTWDRPSFMVGFPFDMFVFGGVNLTPAAKISGRLGILTDLSMLHGREALWSLHRTMHRRMWQWSCGGAWSMCWGGTVGGRWVRWGFLRGHTWRNSRP